MWLTQRALVPLSILTFLSIWFALAALSEEKLVFEVPDNAQQGGGAAVISDADPVQGQSDRQGCQSVLDFSHDIGAKQDRSFFVWPPKRPKSFPSLWRASKRRGRRAVITTLYSVHLKEAIPVLMNQSPPEHVFDELFRCRGFGKTKRVDKALVDAVLAVARHFKSPRMEVISGYRSPKFNDTLAKKGRHVAVESKHTTGEALDFRTATAAATEVAAWLWQNFEGGIGTYKKDNFVHIDMGPKRRWQGR